MKDPVRIYRRYLELQAYVAWSDEDSATVRAPAPLFERHLPALDDDFYAEIARHPEAYKVFTGGQAQIDRLRGALLSWLRHVLTGPYDRAYVVRRWKVGARHVEIGLAQVYTNAALSRLRDGLMTTGIKAACEWPVNRATEAHSQSGWLRPPPKERCPDD
jgi:truncated hemoglobin YjbI